MTRLDPRSDLLPPLLALVLSIGLHGVLLGWLPPLPEPSPREPEAVMVEVRELEPEPAPPGPTRSPAPRVRTPKPSPPPAPRPEDARAGAPRRPPAPPPEAPPERSGKPRPEPPATAERPPPPAPSVPRPPPPEPPASQAWRVQEPVGRAKVPSLADLLPRSQDVRPAPESPPDPAGGTAGEATLWLGDPDARYRGYLEQVQGAIDISWRWKEALLAAGAGGSVVVRFTLTPSGQVEDVEVAEGSGSPILDREAIQAIRRAPLPAFPKHWTIRRLHLVAQFDYRFE